MTLPIPTEENEQKLFVHWLELMNLKFTAIPNESRSGRRDALIRGAHMKAQGVRKGFPDVLVLIPPERAVDGVGRMLLIELKRLKGGTTSPEQRQWINALNDLRVPGLWAAVCRGADEAIEMVDSCLKGERS